MDYNVSTIEDTTERNTSGHRPRNSWKIAEN